MKTRTLLACGALAVVATASGSLLAADHFDSPAPQTDPLTDITDLFAWMTPDAQKLNLAIGVAPLADPGMTFGTSVQYVFHVNSSAGYGEAQTETQVICQFYTSSNIECWAGDEYLEGDPSDPAGITSASGNLRVFAGLRNDPFFFEGAGFNETVSTVVAAAPSLTFDGEGCPAVDADTSAALVGQLQSGEDGAAASDTFAGNDVLALVVQVDKSVVNSGGPVLGVWASTHTAR